MIDKSKNTTNTWIYIILIIILIASLISIVLNYLLFQKLTFDEAGEDGTSFLYPGEDKIAFIPIKYELIVDLNPEFLCYQTSSTEAVEMIEAAAEDPYIKAIVLDINSDGGSIVAASEIAQAVKNAGKPAVAWIRESGSSAAYYIASSADYIIADKYADVGSIGVIIQYEVQNTTYETIKSVKYKDMFSDNRLLNDEERDIVQKQIANTHVLFVEDIAANRGIAIDKLNELANGLSYTSLEAKEMSLVDEIGGKEEVLMYLQDSYGIKGNLVYFNLGLSHFTISGNAASLRESC